MSTRRKLAIATWGSPKEANIYGKMTIDVTAALAYIEKLRAATGEAITITHLVGKAVGEALKQTPSLNGRILFGRYLKHDTVDLAFLVSLQDGADLYKVKVSDIDKKSVVEIARELRREAERLRAGKNEDHQKSTNIARMLPSQLLRPLIWTTGFLTGALGVSIKPFGLERFPFGACIVTNVGVFGLDEAFVPPTPFARVPVYVLVGAVRELPAVVGGQVVPRKMLTLTATLDHRFVDGFQAGTLARTARAILDNPERLLGGVTDVGAAEAGSSLH